MKPNRVFDLLFALVFVNSFFTNTSVALPGDFLETGIAVIKCPASLEVLDSYEGRSQYGYPENPNQNGFNFNDSRSLANKKWQALSPDMAASFSDLTERFLAHAVSIDNAEIRTSIDYGALLVPEGCLLKTVILSRVYSHNSEIFFDRKLWDQLSDYQKVFALHGLFIQEYNAFAYFSKHPFDRTPINFIDNRAVNAFFWSEGFNNYTLQKTLGLLGRLGFLTFPYNGLNIHLGSDHYTFYDESHLQTLINNDNLLWLVKKKKSLIHNQMLSVARGNVTFFPSGHFKCFFTDDNSYYQAQTLGRILRFSSEYDHPLCLDDSGAIQAGYAQIALNDIWTLKNNLIDIVIGTDNTLAGHKDRNTFLEFWPNGQLKMVDSIEGKLFLYNHWVKAKYQLELTESGKVRCAFIFSGEKLTTTQKKQFTVTDGLNTYCFDQNGLVPR